MASKASFNFKNNKIRFNAEKKLQDILERQPIYAKVGFPKSKNTTYPNGTSIIKVALINEYGAEINHSGGTSYGYKSKSHALAGKVRFLPSGEGFMQLGITKAHTIVIPPRPFMFITAKQRKQDVLKEYKKISKFLMKKGNDINQMFDYLAVKYKSWIQLTIRKFDDPRNAPSTIRQKKGVDNPLIDTSLMMQSVSYEIVKGKK